MKSWKKKQRSVQEEIDGWAFDGFNETSTRRDTKEASLESNVTSQRLLKCQLLDLSRERHRAMAQLDYDRDIFLRKQANKRTLPELFRRVHLDPNEMERLQIKFNRRSLTAPSPPKPTFITELPHRPYTSPAELAGRLSYTGPITIASSSLVLSSSLPLHERRSVKDERYRGLVKLFGVADPLKDPADVQRVIDANDALRVKKTNKTVRSFVKDYIRQKGLTFYS